MGVVQLNQIKVAVESLGEKVDVSDVSSDQLEDVRLSRGLAAWVVQQLASIDEERAIASVTDGFQDNGIDAIQIHEEDRVVFVVQSKWSKSGSGSPALGDTLKFLKGFNDLVNARFEAFNQKVKSKQEVLERALLDPNVRFVLVFAHTGQDDLSEESRAEVQRVLSDLNDPIDTASFQMLSQVELHRFLTDGILGKAPDLSVTLFDWGNTQEPYAAYYGQVEASEVAKWHEQNGQRLFGKNIREFLGNDSEVNSSIVTTLKDDPQSFWYLNNGITVLCERVAKSALGGSTKKSGSFEFSGVSVVNGAQTVGCIAEAAKEAPEKVADARVSVRFISLENCPSEFAAEVTRGTNTQNRVERRDFVALDKEQDRIRTELAVDGIRYAIKSGESKPPEKDGCTVLDATVALACSQASPELAIQSKREIGRLWIGAEGESQGSQYRRLFNSGVSGVQVWRTVQILRAVEAALQIERGKREGRERLIGVHGNRLITYLVFRQVEMGVLRNPNEDLIPTIQEVSGLTKWSYEKVVEVVNQEFPSNYLASLFKNNSRCTQIASLVVSQIPVAYDAAGEASVSS